MPSAPKDMKSKFTIPILIFTIFFVLLKFNNIYAKEVFKSFGCSPNESICEEINAKPNQYCRIVDNEKCNHNCVLGAFCTETGTIEGEGIFAGITDMDSGDLNYNDILKVGINITKILLGIIGSVALLMFIISGIKMIFSAGNEQQISSARNIMVQTVIGILIALGAYLIINFIQITILEKDSPYQINKEYKDSNFKKNNS